MDKNYFRVYFDKNNYVGIHANNRNEAKILAQAERIKKGKHHSIKSVENTETNSTFKVI